MKFLVASVLILILCSVSGEARVFGRCEFANAMRGFGFPEDQIPVWVCIANYESHFNTDATNTQTGDHGILQISQIYWCSISNQPGGACNKRCADFHNDDISDDVACAKQIWNEHKRLSGDGFNAWTTYGNCKTNLGQWIAGC